MRLIYHKIFTLIILGLIALLFGSSASIAEIDLIALGEHFGRIGNYDAAITEYKRFLFFHPDDRRAAKIYHQIGVAYGTQSRWQDAIIALRNAVQYAADKKEKSEYQLNLAVILIASKNYDLARLESIKVVLRTQSGPQYKRALFLQAVAYIYQFRWEEARETLGKWTADKKFDTLFDKAINKPHKSVSFAKVLSIILPGAGQLYAGNWKSGVNALALNSTLGYVTVDSILNQHYIDALLWVYFIFQRYYRGNIYRAGKAAEDHNIDASHRAAENILKRLQVMVEKQ